MVKGIRVNLELAKEMMRTHQPQPIMKNGILYEPQKDGILLYERIIEQKREGKRPFPSDRLITNGDLLDENRRNVLVDLCAAAVDNNWCGRSEMCVYFACLLRYALRLLGHKAEVHIGDATYRSESDPNNNFLWEHAWVECNDIIIDANVDTMFENVYVPIGIDPAPYWGEKNQIPGDRSFESKRLLRIESELDELEDTYLEWKRRVKRYLHDNRLISQ